MLEADSHLALMGPVISYKRHGRVYCPGNQQAGSRGSARLANRAERLPRGGCREVPERLAHQEPAHRPDPPRSLKGAAMADLKNSRAQSRLEKAAREGGNTWVGYEAEAKAVREKTARLKALRLAKEAADKSAAAVDESTAARKPATKRALKSSGAPPMSADRSKDGRRD
jgi:hypothetical protein